MRGGPGERADGGGSDQVPAPFLPAEGSAKSSGPVFAVQRPSRETVKKWRNNGTLVMASIGGSLFVDVHMTLKKNKIKLGVLNN